MKITVDNIAILLLRRPSSTSRDEEDPKKWRKKIAQIFVKIYYIVALGIYINILVHQMFA